jgi:hypothetical protein
MAIAIVVGIAVAAAALIEIGNNAVFRQLIGISEIFAGGCHWSYKGDSLVKECK